MTSHANALSVVQVNGEPYLSVSDFLGLLTSMRLAIANEDQRKLLDRLITPMETMLAGQPQGQPPPLVADPCPSCQRPVATLRHFAEDYRLTVEVFTSADGPWVVVDLVGSGGTVLVPWEPCLDGVGGRVHEHDCNRTAPARSGPT